MIERRKDLRFSPKSSESIRVRREGIRQHLQRIVPLERRVVRPPDLAHAALANQGGDFVGTETSAGADGHLRRILRQPADCTWTQTNSRTKWDIP